MTIGNPSKALIAMVALICITVLRAIDQMDQASYNGLAGLIVGYAVGNTMSAAKRETVEPIIKARDGH